MAGCDMTLNELRTKAMNVQEQCRQGARPKPSPTGERVRYYVLLIVGFASVLLSLAGQSRAAEIGCALFYQGEHSSEDDAQKRWPSGFRPTASMCEVGFISGRIVVGDYEKVLTLYRGSHRLLDEFLLRSGGGDVGEAIKIGGLFRKYLISVVTPRRDAAGKFSFSTSWRKNGCSGPQCICAGACALMWFGAVERFGIVGLRKPRVDDPEFKAMAVPDAMRTLDGIARYLTEMEAPREVIDAMTKTDASEISWGNALGDLDRAPSFAEWVDAACGRFTTEEWNTFVRLNSSPRAKLSKDDGALIDLLRAKVDRHLDCQSQLVSARVDRMEVP
jgi:hypothetical protein